MPQTHLLVIDLETVPDADILPADRDPETFPKPIQHRIVTLGFLLARILPDGQRERYEVRRLGAASLAERTEREIIAGFWHLVDRHRPRVVTWNGRVNLFSGLLPTAGRAGAGVCRHPQVVEH